MSSLSIWAQYLTKFVSMYCESRISEGITFKGYGLGEPLPGFAVTGGVALLFLLPITGSVRDGVMA